MTELERLKALLDQRGEPYVVNDFGVTWRYHSDPHTATESMDGTLIVTGLTARQAIDATIGREPDDAEVDKLHDRLNVALHHYAENQEHTKERIEAVLEAHMVIELAIALGCGETEVQG